MITFIIHIATRKWALSNLDFFLWHQDGRQKAVPAECVPWASALRRDTVANTTAINIDRESLSMVVIIGKRM